MKRAMFVFILCLLSGSPLTAQPPKATKPLSPEEKHVATQAVLTAAFVPYMVDLFWQVPLGSRLGWVTSSASNPTPRRTRAQVFLLRGTGTLFTPGFGDLCTRLRQSNIWTEDLGSVGESWIIKHLQDERKAGRLTGPIILVGHSRGGRHIIDAAHELQKSGIMIDLLICIDVAAPAVVPGNVRQALNLYLTQHRLYPAEILKASPGSPARIDNIDLNAPASPIKVHAANHLNLTADPGVQDFILKAIARTVSEAAQP